MVTNHCNATSFTETQDNYLINTNREIWLNHLMDNHGENIIRLAYSYVSDKSAAEDIAQITGVFLFNIFHALVLTAIILISMDSSHKQLKEETL
ncbi:hypothetical protein CVD19_08800 [Bacillus sp. T33-2]|nr:hypothetical protein CVD19_08800 [Bacillus sp. T33-2]